VPPPLGAVAVGRHHRVTLCENGRTIAVPRAP
jgi:hypothetical protein